MKKAMLILGLSLTSCLAFAADTLDGTKWKTIDDKTKKALSIVQFTENSNGTFSAKIVKVLEPTEDSKCVKCEGKYKGKSLTGIQIVSGLKKVGKNTYENGQIVDPQNGKTYSFKAKLSEDGKTFSGRGYLGVSALGRSQTWIRAD
ncbi:DUF2147 domain-containing protein [Acinetobacter shaoyimingii]|uniref:DUF2147 domain-containing protein n=1 Tax=Acinetobacter shaoyimingii TaxID=2715164 RepID=A0A6G8S047_9GAMM|nr:DUF2147 domain-containing protein [Acinetobacter shaoyimingii]NHB58982.1 DUF2147 domain-containing protein [Acinetobacter shaoyimingii]QIO07470.1 DUF2147 domain-containing protein [Acinetobacter shaoyimingii]